MTPPRDPRVEVTHDGGTTIARVVNCPRLADDTTAQKLGRQLAGLVTGTTPHLVVDLAEVEFLSSPALAAFVGTHKLLREGGGRLTLVNVHPMLREVFAVTRLDTLFDVQTAPTDGPPHVSV